MPSRVVALGHPPDGHLEQGIGVKMGPELRSARPAVDQNPSVHVIVGKPHRPKSSSSV
ncbi:MAG TPA: hypothetical protein VMS65_08485 [Polyangiaceae bacterium]|nr:hypothetical protein [Polyangiaceae bacterium]